MTLSQRLALLKKNAGMTTETLSGLSGVPKGTINKILNGETENPRAQTLRQLARALGCSPEALYEETPAAEHTPNPASPSITVYGEPNPAPIPTGDMCIRVPDDSMSAARLKKGDLVFIRRTTSPDDGSIAALILDGALTLRRLYRIKDGVTLLSENSAFPPVVLTGPDMSRLEILGQAIAFTANL